MSTDTPATSPASRFWAAVPRGARLDEQSFTTRHRILSGVLALRDVGAAGHALSGVQEIISGVVEAQGTIAAAVEEQSASTAQAQEAITGASREAAAMAAELLRIVAPA